MIKKLREASMDLVILRPYALSSGSSLANDRYFALAKSAIRRGFRVLLVAQSFSHSSLRQRSSKDLQVVSDKYVFARFISVPSYKKSTGLGRLFAELIYAFEAFIILVSLRPSRVLVGEPLFFTGWLALLYGFVFGKLVSCDLIDAWPEALSVPKYHPFALIAPFNILCFPLVASRSLRLVLYKRVFTVSESYISLIPRSVRNRVKVFYWCSQTFSNMATHVPNELNPYQFGPGSPFVISYAGSLGSGYDILTIIEAALILEQRFPGCFIFKIAGGGHKSILFDQINAKNIFFLGYLPSSEVRAVLSSSNSMLLPYAPNSAVAMPIKFFDAINLQLPVVSSLGLEAGDLITRYKIGTFYQAQNPESLAEAIINIRESYQSYSQNSREFFDRFSGVYASSGTYDKFAVELMG